jgi:serine/threonine protein phosphatase PrpC
MEVNSPVHAPAATDERLVAPTPVAESGVVSSADEVITPVLADQMPQAVHEVAPLPDEQDIGEQTLESPNLSSANQVEALILVQEPSDNREDAMNHSGIAQAESPPASASPALEVGTLIAERYCVLSSQENGPGQWVYQVEDQGVCRSCGAAVQATEEEPYCFNCGAHLLQSTLLWPVRTLQEIAADADNATFVWQARAFVLSNPAELENQVEIAAPLANGVNLLVGQRSHVGVSRVGGPDEDSIFVLTTSGIYQSYARPTIGLYIVADGMGGHGDGEVASRTAVETMVNCLMPSLVLPLLQGQAQSPVVITELLNQAIQMANRQIHVGALARNNDMGTTLTLAFVVNDQAYVANIGDSRTYLWGRTGLRQITQDHSHVYTLYKNGALSEEGIYTHPRRNEIYRSLGGGNPVNVDHFQVGLTPGDLLLLCCDGLWEMVRYDGIADVHMLNLGDPQIICDELVSRANHAGGEDNISVVVVRAAA